MKEIFKICKNPGRQFEIVPYLFSTYGGPWKSYGDQREKGERCFRLLKGKEKTSERREFRKWIYLE